MTAAFIVTLNVPDSLPDTLAGLSEHIQESLEDDGLSVTSVKPYAHPTAGLEPSPGPLDISSTSTQLDSFSSRPLF